MRGPHLLLLLAAGCATASPRAELAGYLVDPRGSPHPACRPSASFLAVGSSPAGASEAEQRARAAVVRQVSSEIQVETVRVLETSQQDGVLRQSRALQERTRERAHFEHAHLIRTPGAPGARGGVTYVLACLDRGELVAVLQAELDPALVRFTTASGEALKEGTSRPGFVLGYNAALREVPGIVAMLAQIRAVAGRAAAGEDLFRELWRRLVQEAARVRSAVNVRVAIEPGLDAELRGALAEAVRGALVASGLRAELGEPGCDTVTHLLVVRGSPACAWGPLGHACRLHVEARATDCAGERIVFEGPIGGDLAHGIDARSEALALQRCLRHLTAEALAPPLKRMLGSDIALGDTP